MPIITLTTDFGEKDHFAGAVKGSIYSELSDVRIVDVSHSISPFNIIEAAYTIQNAYQSFPKGTIHIIGIDSELSPENKHIAVKLDDNYFICANNGIMSMICQDIAPEKIVEINIHDKIQTSFPVLDVFVKVACHIARGGTLEVIGKVINNIKPIKYLEPFVNDEKNQIIGTVIHVDNYGNATTNIRKAEFERIQKGRSFEILFGREDEKITEISSKYKDVSVPEKLALFGENNLLQIAINKGSAKTLLGLKIHELVRVDFK